MSKKTVIIQQPEEGIPMPLIIIFIVMVLGGIGYFIYSKMTGAPAAGASAAVPISPPATDQDANGQAINAGGYLIDAGGKLITDANGEPILGAGVAGDGNGTSDVVSTLTDVVSSVKNLITGQPESTGFPLAQVSGAALHVANPYVKDVQQYLNKFGGAKLDIDGAFGVETEAAVFKTFGTTTITADQYNTTIAPPLGKPAV